jgi:hypothetical protein
MEIYIGELKITGDFKVALPQGTTSAPITTAPPDAIEELEIQGNSDFQSGLNLIVISGVGDDGYFEYQGDVEVLGKPDSPEDVIIRPGVGILALFKTMNYKLWVALGELVDNSIQSFDENRVQLKKLHGPDFKLRVDIEFNASPIEHVLVRDNAAGIAAADVHRAFTPAVRRVNRSGLGQFGVGMKSACAWYSDYFSITSSALGESVTREVTFDVPTIIDNNIEKMRPAITPKEPEVHGTTIVMQQLNHGLPASQTLGRVRSYLSSIYREPIRNNEIEIYVGGKKLYFDDYVLLNEPYWPDKTGPLFKVENGSKVIADETLWRLPIDFQLQESWNSDRAPSKPNQPPRIRGWVGILETGSTKRSGFALIWRGKVVVGAGAAAEADQDAYRPREVFGASTSFPYQRIVGEIDISELDVTTYKDSVQWRPGQEDELKELLRDAVDAEGENSTIKYSLLKQAMHYRSTLSSEGISQEVQKALNDAKSEATRALLAALEAQADGIQPDVSRVVFETDSILGAAEGKVLIYREPDSNENYMLEIISNSLEPRLVSTVQNNRDLIIRLNRNHPFMENYAHLPGAQLDPVIRLLVAVALTQIKLEREGVPHWYLTMDYVNEFLSKWFGKNDEV